MTHMLVGCYCCQFFEAYQAQNVFSNEFKRMRAQQSWCHGPTHSTRSSLFLCAQTGIFTLYLLTEVALTHNNLLSVHISHGWHWKDTFTQCSKMGLPSIPVCEPVCDSKTGTKIKASFSKLSLKHCLFAFVETRGVVQYRWVPHGGNSAQTLSSIWLRGAHCW